MKKYLMIVSLFLITHLTFSQEDLSLKINDEGLKNTEKIKPLKIGDKVSDIAFDNVLNYKRSKAKLSDFRGKYIILDFWATWCNACVKKFPELDSLQSEFNDRDFQILLVNSKTTGDNISSVKTFFNKRKNPKGKLYTLPCVVNDSILEILFPHRTVPHYILIDPNGIVQAITSSNEITKAAILDFINGKSVSFHIKREDMEFDKTKPFFEEGNAGYYNKSIYRSFLSGYLEGLPVAIGNNRNDSNLITRFYAINLSIIGLYRHAYSELFSKFSNNRMILQVKDSARYDFNPFSKDEDWKRENSFCYEIILPPTSIANVKHYFQEDLKRYFGLKIYSEKRNTKCIVLKPLCKINSNAKATVRDQKPNHISCSNGSSSDSFHITSMQQLLRILNSKIDIPVVDGCHFSGKLEIKGSSKDLSNINTARLFLNKNGINLIQEEREIEFLILSE